MNPSVFPDTRSEKREITGRSRQIGNDFDRFNDYFRQQCEAAKLKPVLWHDNIEIIPSCTEQKSELAEYSKKFDHNPKIQATITLRVLRKG